MQISKISGIKNVNSQKRVLSGIKNNTIPLNRNSYNPSEVFKIYYGRDIVSFGKKPFNETLKQNYFHLPDGCYPDAFQLDAAKALNEGRDVLVEAPTGTGKTAIAYYAASKNMEEGKTTFYTTPLKALSNQKLNEFQKIYGKENVGILTGDRRENVEAPIIIMTTEVYRNMALAGIYGEKNPLMENLGTVIFDEFHYMGDPDRGPVWEESVMFTPKDVQTLELSATIGNPEELRNWINSLKENDSVSLVSIPPEARSVPLHFDSLSTDSYEKSEKKIQKAIKRGETPELDTNLTVKKPKLSDFKSAVEQLNDKKQLPAIFFIFSKKYSKEVLEYLGKEGLDLTTGEEKKEIQNILDRYTSQKYIGADLDTEALKKGYAIHNAGIIPGQKELIEELFQKKLLKAVIATETLAAGINMPAKTVVISSPYKPCDDESDTGRLLDVDTIIKEEETDDEDKKTPVRMLSANEFKQMSGRAGRRGIDTVGYVYTMPVDRTSQQDFLYLEIADCNSVQSNYAPDYDFLSGYYEHNNDSSKLPEIYGKSFFAYNQNNSAETSGINELMEISSRKTNVLKDRGFLVENDGKTEPSILAHMASHVKGYDTLTLTEMIASGVLNGISPQALAMIAASMAVPSKQNETAINFDSDFFGIFEKTRFTTGDVYQKTINSINSMLSKFGKNINSFSDYDEMLDFVQKTEKPQVSVAAMKSALHELEAQKVKMYKIIKTTGKYSAGDLVKALKKQEVIPSKVLESGFEAVQSYKKRINAQNIDDYAAKLRHELSSIDTSVKGNKAKARLDRKKKELEELIKTAEEMKFLDENIPEALSSNYQFLKKNPPQKIKENYNNAETMYYILTTKDILLDKIRAIKKMEETFDGSDTRRIESDSKKIKETFKVLLNKAAEIYNTEINNGIKPQAARFNEDAAETAYLWAGLNIANPYDSEANWSQIVRMKSDDVDEGTIYRNIMQTADLLSQIGEMAYAGVQNSSDENDIEYYTNLKSTALEARNLLLKEPIEIF